MYRLDNSNRLVTTYTKILNLLYKENMSVNEIIEQTSKDRTYVIDILKKLEINGFIEPIEFQKQHKQKKFKKLSKLGLELAHFAFNIENFNSEYFKLNKVIDEYKELDKKIDEYKRRDKKIKNIEEKEGKNKPITMTNKTTIRIVKTKDRNLERFLKEKLKEKGWTDTEISYYDECKEGLYYVDISLHEGIIKILLQKFLLILDNFNLNVGAREIINQIIIEIFQIQLSNIVTNVRTRYTEYLMKPKHKNRKIDYSPYYPSFTYEPLDYIHNLMFPFSLPVMGIVEELMICYLNLLKPSKEIIEGDIEYMKNDIENAPDYEINEGDMNREELRMRSRCLINAYEEYLKSN